MTLIAKKSLSLYLLVALILTTALAGYLYMPDRASAAIALTNKENNVSTSFPTTTTGSLSWTAGARGIASVVLACPGGGASNSGEVEVAGGSETWNEIGFVTYNRRAVYVFLSDSVPTNGTLSITYDNSPSTDCNGAGTPLEIQYSVDQITGFDTGNPDDPSNTNSASSGTSLNIGDVGTIDAGDVVYAAFGMENASDGLVPASGSTAHVTREGGGNVRSLLVAYSTTDDTPGATWNSSGSAGGVAFIINVGAEAPVDSTNPNIQIRGGGGGGGAVAIDTQNSNDSGFGNTSMNINVTVGSNNNRALVLFVGAGDQTNGVVSSVSGGGADCSSSWTQVGSSNGNGVYHGDTWACVAPSTGAQTITINFAGTTDASMGAVIYSLYNVNQTTPTSGYGAATSGNLIISTATGDMTLSAHFDLTDNRTISGCTTTRDISAFGGVGIDSTHCTDSSSTTFTWSGFGTDSIAMGVNIKQVPATSPNPFVKIRGGAGVVQEVVLDTSNVSVITDSSLDSASGSHTVPSGTDLLVVFLAGYITGNTSPPTSIVWNNGSGDQNLTRITLSASGEIAAWWRDDQHGLWYLANPNAGAGGTITITGGDSSLDDGGVVHIVNLSGVDTSVGTSGIRSFVSYADNSPPSTVTLSPTTSSTDLIVTQWNQNGTTLTGQTYGGTSGVQAVHNATAFNFDGTFLTSSQPTGSGQNVTFLPYVGGDYPSGVSISVAAESVSGGSSGGGAQTPAYVQNASDTDGTAIFGSNVTSGNVIAVGVGYYLPSANLTSVSADCVSGGFTITDEVTGDTGRLEIAYGVVTSTGSCTVTANYGTPGDIVAQFMVAHEISGIDTASPLDKSALNSQVVPGTGTDALTSGNVVTTSDGQYIFGITFDDSLASGTLSPGTDYTGRITGAGLVMASEDRIQASTGSIAATFTSNVALTTYITGIMTFKPVSGGGTSGSVKFR